MKNNIGIATSHQTSIEVLERIFLISQLAKYVHIKFPLMFRCRQGRCMFQGI